MYVHHHGARSSHLLDVVLWMHNHQVNVERLLALLCNSLYDGESERDVRHEHAVHDVEVKPVGLAAVYHVDVRTQVDEVR